MDPRITRLRATLAQAIVGKDEAINLTLAALLAGGHALLEDVPGVGKTLLAKSLAKAIAGTFQRIQCTPDLLPTDITGTSVWNPQNGSFEFLPGPIFGNIVLADEINRATPRTQSALLEVMEEQQVTVDGKTRPVPSPFFVIATQNPVEYQGTYPLPEAQLDRFAVCFSLGYPSQTEELHILARLEQGSPLHSLTASTSLEDIQELRRLCLQVKVTPPLQTYIVNLVRATRTHPDLTLGASPRASVMLQRLGQAWALLQGSPYVSPDMIKRLVPYVLVHRVIPQSGKSAPNVISSLLETVPVP
ncbi:MAG: MoxR family ATPase [Thermostichales cyanobacterium BF4_bins_65]